MAEEEAPLPGHFQDTREEEPDVLGSLADCQVCSLGKVLHLPGLLSGGGDRGEALDAAMVPCGSETHCEPIQTFRAGLSLQALCALAGHYSPPPPNPRLITEGMG